MLDPQWVQVILAAMAICGIPAGVYVVRCGQAIATMKAERDGMVENYKQAHQEHERRIKNLETALPRVDEKVDRFREEINLRLDSQGRELVKIGTIVERIDRNLSQNHPGHGGL